MPLAACASLELKSHWCRHGKKVNPELQQAPLVLDIRIQSQCSMHRKRGERGETETEKVHTHVYALRISVIQSGTGLWTEWKAVKGRAGIRCGGSGFSTGKIQKREEGMNVSR